MRESSPVPDNANQTRINIAILAVGGQGGGVLSNWLLALAEANGWRAQNTSVPGVAQRTGATVYYIEMLPETGRDPVLALMPGPGEVDVCVAAELMEAGRAIQRGLVAPDRTLLITSSHRAYSVAEKSAPGDGTIDASAVLTLAESMAQRFLHADMARIAQDAGSVISAALFGAIAGSGVLPFSRAAFEATIQGSGGAGTAASLTAFAAGFDAVVTDVASSSETSQNVPQRRLLGGSDAERRRYKNACQRIHSEFPEAAHEMLQRGLNTVIDFQDAAYGDEYLDRIANIARADAGERSYALTLAGAKYLARAMAYDDVIRVAELKTRRSRTARVRDEVGAQAMQIVYITEFMHPRLEEVCGTLPARLGGAIERNKIMSRALRRFFNRGRRVRSDALLWFVLMSLLAGMRRWRRGSLRHQREHQRIDEWMDLVLAKVAGDYDLAVEILKCQRLLKGYSDTHARASEKYKKVLSVLERLDDDADPAGWIRRLREAALQDEEGTALDELLATFEHRAFSPEGRREKVPPPSGRGSG
jgi:indolepyruvate ferredoxin oxidoreductase beta subunit